MKILIAGNSQAGCIKTALDTSPNDKHSILKNTDWIVVPGGHGPNLKLNKDRIEIVNFNPRFPPRIQPSEKILSNSINEYDLIFISALGYVDGGYIYKSPIATIDTCFPVTLDLLDSGSNSTPVSRFCFATIANHKWSNMVGFKFLAQLRSIFKGKIVVQPNPLLSESIISKDDWFIAKKYKDPYAANQFMLGIKDNFLSKICKENDCDLLPYPNNKWRNYGFTPKEYINEDMIHPNVSYGRLIISQFEKKINEVLKKEI